jgi:hypothetical protein
LGLTTHPAIEASTSGSSVLRFATLTSRHFLADLNPNAQHQKITFPAPSGGLIILSDQNYREAFSHHFPIFVRAHTAPNSKWQIFSSSLGKI